MGEKQEGAKKALVLLELGSFGERLGYFGKSPMVFMRASLTKQGFRGNGRLLGKFVAQIKSKGTKWMENVTRKVGPPRLKDHIVPGFSESSRCPNCC